MEKVEEAKIIKSWTSLVRTEAELNNSNEEWIYRGEPKRQPLRSTLQRVCEEFEINPLDVPHLEARLIQDFKRNYPVYATALGSETEDPTYWLSLMRHYGAPTRFLDFTYSFFIASFFALETPIKLSDTGATEYEPAAVWAVSKTWLTRKAFKLMKQLGGLKLCKQWGERKTAAFQRLFWHPPHPKTIFPVNPYRSHQRLHVQQGIFLCPGNVSIGFDENLLAIDGWKENVRLILIDSSCRKQVLWEFHRAGLSRELLFPGLDGYAKSLCVAGPLVFIRQKELEKFKARVPTNARGQLQWTKFAKWQTKGEKPHP